LLNVEDLHGFAGFAEQVRTGGISAPETCEELQTLLSKSWYSNRVTCRDGYVLVETDDDEVELAFWWVSEEVLAREQDRFACYASDVMPSEIGRGGFDPACGTALAGHAERVGAVFGAFVTVWDGGNLLDLPGPIEVRGTRLPDFLEWLRAAPPGGIIFTGSTDNWAIKGHLLEIDWLALVARENPALDLNTLLHRAAEVPLHEVDARWKQMSEGAIGEDEFRRSVQRFNSRKSSIYLQVADNLIEFRFFNGFVWHTWILFDDLWASAHPVLARSLLRFCMPISG
jgi:hypothetical protein